MKVCDKYPEWLAVQAEALSQADYDRYGTQYQVGWSYRHHLLLLLLILLK
jgi:hypothetical protein